MKPRGKNQVQAASQTAQTQRGHPPANQRTELLRPDPRRRLDDVRGGLESAPGRAGAPASASSPEARCDTRRANPARGPVTRPVHRPAVQRMKTKRKPVATRKGKPVKSRACTGKIWPLPRAPFFAAFAELRAALTIPDRQNGPRTPTPLSASPCTPTRT
jgi:hypothetical protein